jgi:hypothetical protein
MAQSGHRDGAEECPLSGVKRTSIGRNEMSDPKRTFSGLFDQLVGSHHQAHGHFHTE